MKTNAVKALLFLIHYSGNNKIELNLIVKCYKHFLLINIFYVLTVTLTWRLQHGWASHSLGDSQGGSSQKPTSDLEIYLVFIFFISLAEWFIWKEWIKIIMREKFHYSPKRQSWVLSHFQDLVDLLFCPIKPSLWLIASA